MGKNRFELYLPGLNELMRGPEMQAAISEACTAVANNANGMAQTEGASYSFDIKPGYWIAIGRVRADNYPAVRSNLESNTLVKALGSAGLNM